MKTSILSADALASLRTGAVALANLYRTRLELLLLDLEEEKERLEQRLILSAVAGFLFTLGSIGATAFFVMLLWPSIGMGAIALFAVLYLGAAGGVVLKIQHGNRERHRTFAWTLQEFEKDAGRFAQILQEQDTPQTTPVATATPVP